MYRSISYKNKKLMLFLFILCMLFSNTICQYSSPSSCTPSQFYNIINHACQQCPNSNTIPSKIDNSFCNCSLSSYPNPDAIGFNYNTACLNLGSTLGANDIAMVYNRFGALQTPITVITCGTDSYPNTQRTKCIPCGFNMIYSSTLKMCICSSTNFYPINGICVDGSSFPSISTGSSNSVTAQLLGMATLGCTTTNPSKQYCQIILNKCAQNGYSSTNQFCILLNSANSNNLITPYTVTSSDLSTSIGIYASSVQGTNSKTVKNKLDFIAFQYDTFGKLLDIKHLDNSIFPCIANAQDIIKFQSFGLNLLKSCIQADKRPNTSTYYDIFVLNNQSNYVQIYTNISSTFYKRFYRSSNYNSISMKFISNPPLSIPYLGLSQQLPPQITTSSSSKDVNLVLTAPFIIFNVLALISFLISFYKFMKYNPYDQNDPYMCFKIIFIFLIRAIRHWGIFLWIWLFGVSAYCFCFYKFQQTVYLLLPDIKTQWLQYYDPFMIIFYLQFSFVFISVLLLIYDLGWLTDYFLIDWQKQKNLSQFQQRLPLNKNQISVWRKIMLVNQLYQLTIKQIVQLPFVILFGIVFLSGLNWINLQYQIPNVNNLNQDFSNFSTKNVVLAYFIITFIFFIIAVVQYILRHLVKIWKPLPHEDFVDLCCIANISLIMFDQQRHGYYLHGMNPLGQAEGSLKYIQSVFQKQAKSFGKSRAFKNNDPNQTQVFEVVFPQKIRHQFQMMYKSRYLQKLTGRAQDTSILSKPISKNLNIQDYEQLQKIQVNMSTNFKYYLQGIKISSNNVKQQLFWQRALSCPIDDETMGKLPIFFKDYWYRFTQVLLSGHQFTLLINIINFINIFYIATGSVVIACLITMVICRLVVKNLADFFIKRNLSRNTFIDDKFFN